MLGRSSPDRAKQDIESHLARCFPDPIGETTIVASLEKFGIAGQATRQVLKAVWATALESSLADNALTESELRYLEQLARNLNLGSDETRAVMAELAHPRYAKAVAAVVADLNVTDEERASLKALGDGLQLPEEARLRIYAEQAGPLVQGAVDAAIADRRFAPEERAGIEAIAKRLGVDAKPDANAARVLDRFTCLWEIENGQLPEIQAPISLQRGEVCHYQCAAEWHELRTRTTRIDYAGPTGSIRIAKGIRFRIGSIAPRRVTREEMTHVDDGQVYITSKRVIFDGAKRNTAIRFSALIGIQVYQDGLVLEKATGRSPHLLGIADPEIAGAILSTAMGGP